ncbi:unnamed protein product [Parnassius apollo]|uniref:(apollo) hypothetical protein n=1 Tax=Parnassius apollo TaxID=110799 RepID=A0A8S3WPX2_PARAO|nr:unnamed protein product [Parnassius apollo]
MSFIRDQIQPSRSESNITNELTSYSDENDDAQDSRSEINVASPFSSIAVSAPAHSLSPSLVSSTSSRGKKRKSANELRSEFLEIEKKRLYYLKTKKVHPMPHKEAP